MEGLTIAIVGLGGTGSYVLDLVAKTPVAAIHLFDDDVFDQHNAFRAPGAAAKEEIAARRAKVDHFAAIYSNMHRGIVPHRTRLDGRPTDVLRRLDFAFVCVDDGGARRAIVSVLERLDVPFVDTGMGLHVGAYGLFGLARVTASTTTTRDEARACMPLEAPTSDDLYRTVVQVADINALSAALAVLRWKRLLGFYADEVGEHQSVFATASSALLTSIPE